MLNKDNYRLGMHLARVISCLLFLICIVFVYFIIITLRPAILPDVEYRAENGILDLRSFHFDEPIEIVGEWERIPYVTCNDVNCMNLTIDFDYFSNISEIVEIPMPFTTVSTSSSAYRLLIRFDYTKTDAYILLSPIQSDYYVFFNGVHVFDSNMDSMPDSLFPMLPVSAFNIEIDPERKYQELVILVCDDYDGAIFFHSEFILGSSDPVRMYVIKRVAIWALITGLFIMLIVNRLIFMMICPEHEIASLTTIIDAAVMIRVLLGIPELYHIKFVLFDFSISNAYIARVNFLPVLIIGIVTIHFIARIFNAYNQTNKKWFLAVTTMSCIVGLVFFLNINLMATDLGFAIYLLFFLPGSFLGGWVFARYLKSNRLTKLQIFYVVLLVVTGLMIVYDMQSIRNTNGNFLTLLSGYFALVFLHLCASLWENYSKYKEYEKLSRGFEETAKALRLKNIHLQDATDEQRRLEQLLQTVNNAATVLLAVEDKDGFESALKWSMEMIGHCLNADRVQLWRTSIHEDSATISLNNQWLSEVGKKFPQIELSQNIAFGSLPKIEDLFFKGECFNGPVVNLPMEEQVFLNSQGALKSVVIIPVYLRDKFWGFFTIDDCINERTLSNQEMDILRSASLMIASTEHRVEQAAIMQRIEIVEESNRAKSKFLARMSHEIRTPITSVMGLSEIHLQDNELPSNIEESFSKIHNSANLLLSIINDILDLSKIEAGKMTIKNEVYELAGMISDVTNLHLANLIHETVKFHIYVDEDLPVTLIGDVIRIEQILNNLLSNSFKYTASGSVELAFNIKNSEYQDQVVLIVSIRDTGMGMTPDQVKMLYNEYTRFHEKDDNLVNGTGLGMPIVYSLAKMMDAHIDIKSEVNKGTNVVIHIPQKIVDTKVLGKEAALQLQKFETDDSALAKRFKFTPESMPYGSVLIVDDVEANLFVAKGLLTFYNLNIETCNNGYEAIEKIEQGEEYNIIFMDHMMPGIDGMETMQILREKGYNKPIVALTANTMMGQEEAFLQNGFDDFISKPIQTKQLNAVLIKHIKNKQPARTIEAAVKETFLQEGQDVNMQDIDNFQNNANIVEKLRLDFARDKKGIFDDISKALSEGEYKTAHLLSHSVKGLAWLIKEDSLALAAKNVEHILAEGKIPERHHLQELESELIRVLASIKEPELKPPPSNVELDSDKAQALFDNLDSLLKSSNAECLDLVDELRAVPETSTLIRQIEDFEFKEALKTLDNLRVLLRH